MALDIRRASCVLPAQNAAGIHRVHHLFDIRVDDGQRQPRKDCLRQKRLRNDCSLRQSEGNIRYAQHGFKPQLCSDAPNGFQRLPDLPLLSGNRQRQAVDGDIFTRNSLPDRRIHNLVRECHAFVAARRQSAFAKCQTDDCRTVFFRQRKDGLERAFRRVDAVDEALARCGTQSRFNRRRIGGINLQGQTDRAADGGHHPAHQIDLINSGQTNVDIQNLCACVRLLNRLRDDIIHILFAECLLKTLLARRIDSLANDAHTLSKRAYLARRANAMDGFSRPYRFFPRQFSAKRLNKCGRCSAAPADICRTDVGQLRARRREFLRICMVFARRRIGKPRIRLQNEWQIRTCSHRTQDRRNLNRSE